MRPGSVRSDIGLSVRVLYFTFLVCVCGMTATAFGQTNDVWTGLGGDGLWGNPSNWSNGVPNGNFNVLIDNGNAAHSAVTLNMSPGIVNLTIDSDDSLSFNNGSGLGVTLGGTINDAGPILLNSTGSGTYLYIGNGIGTTTLTGGGTVTLSDTSHGGNAYIFGDGSATLENVKNTIQGEGQLGIGHGVSLRNDASGVINANVKGQALTWDAYNSSSYVLTNTGILEATNGGILLLNPPAVNNLGGTITTDSGKGSQVLVNSGDIQGGTLRGTINVQGSSFFDGTTQGALTNAGTVTILNGQNLNINPANSASPSTIQNNSSIAVSSAGGGTYLYVGNGSSVLTKLTGGGTVTLSDTSHGGNAYIFGDGSATLENVNNTIQGEGQLGIGHGVSLQNDAGGVINANVSGQALTWDAYGSSSYVLTNKGTLEATNGALLALSTTANNGTIKTVGTGSQVQTYSCCALTNFKTLAPGTGGLINITGPFTNFSGTTLTGGTYTVAGTLKFVNANIMTNAAKITLSGTASQIVDQNDTNALANFTNNAAKGSFSLASKKKIVVGTLFNNAGTLKVGAGTSFQATSYTQTGGTTTVDGTLTAPSGMTIQAGKVYGKGTIASTVISSGSVTPGDSPTKPGKLSPSTYTQNANGSLNIQVGGLTVGTQYSQLAVANGVSLSGTLNIKLINGYVPNIGDTFTILTAAAVTGQFSTVNGLSINGAEHFQISYGASGVTLTVEPGA